jgi:hypothetical protein
MLPCRSARGTYPALPDRPLSLPPFIQVSAAVNEGNSGGRGAVGFWSGRGWPYGIGGGIAAAFGALFRSRRKE